MTKVIFLNGPPRCGKDTVGEIIMTLVPGSRVTKMAHKLKVGTHALFRALHGRLTPTTLHAVLDDATYEDMKDEPLPLFFGETPRKAYIDVSEKLIKPMFGDEFWGELVAKQIIASGPKIPLWIITDTGFEPETRPIIRLVGKENCTLIRLRRHGCDFSKDSRSYLQLDYGIAFHTLINNMSIANLTTNVRCLPTLDRLID